MAVPAVRAFGDALEIASQHLTEEETLLVEQFIFDRLSDDEITDELAVARPAVLYKMKTALKDRFWDLTPGQWTKLAVALSHEGLPGERDYNRMFLTEYWEGTDSLRMHVNTDWGAEEENKLTHRQLDTQFMEAVAVGTPVSYEDSRFRFIGVAPEHILHADCYPLEERILGVAGNLHSTGSLLLEAKMMTEADMNLSSVKQTELVNKLFHHPAYPMEFFREDFLVKQAIWMVGEDGSHPLGTLLFQRGLLTEKAFADTYVSPELHLLCHSEPAFEMNQVWSSDPKFLLARPDLNRDMLEKFLTFRAESKRRSNIAVWEIILRRPLLPAVELLHQLIAVEKIEEWEFELLLDRLEIEGGVEEFLGDKRELIDLPARILMDVVSTAQEAVRA